MNGGNPIGERSRFFRIVALTAVIIGVVAFLQGFQGGGTVAHAQACDADCDSKKHKLCPTKSYTGSKKYTKACQTPKPGEPKEKDGLLGKKCTDRLKPGGATGYCKADCKCFGTHDTDGKPLMMPMMMPMMPMMGGMPPMLPMIPMGGGDMPMMPMMPSYCPPKDNTNNNTGTTSSSTSPTSSTTPLTGSVRPVTDPNCIQDFTQGAMGGGGGGFWSPDIFGDTQSGGGGEDGSGDDTGDSGGVTGSSVWARLMSSLGIGSDDGEDDEEMEEEFSFTGSSTTRVASKTGTQRTQGSTTQSGTYASSQTFVTYDLASQSGQQSTFSYQGEIDTTAQDTATILANLTLMLQRLLAIVMSWLNG